MKAIDPKKIAGLWALVDEGPYSFCLEIHDAIEEPVFYEQDAWDVSRTSRKIDSRCVRCEAGSVTFLRRVVRTNPFRL